MPNPKVLVDQDENGNWVAVCLEHRCGWSNPPSEKTYTKQRATAHRKQHRAQAVTQ